MPEGYLLSDADLQKLRKLLSEHGVTKVQHRPDEPLSGAPEVYVAKVKTDPGSIPALTPKDADAYDHPGCAMCDIYQIMPGIGSEDWDLVPISGISHPVYNLTTTEVGDDWLLVIRDKSGRWVATVSGVMPPGEELNDILYWDGDEWIILHPPAGTGTGEHYTLKIEDGQLLWINDEAAGTGTGTGGGISVVTDVRIDGNNLQIKTRTLYPDSSEVGSDWTTVHAGTECA